jgi:RNA polymerase sigma-70 factor (ECF subfamily)
MSELALVERLKQGDTEAFRELYDHHARLVFRYVKARIESEQDAEDLTAETFIRAWRGLSSFQWQGKPIGAWLLRIAHNLIVDKYRQKRSLTGWLPWSSGSEEPDFAQVDHKDEIKRAFTTLTSDEQTILHLRYFEDFSLNEVAEFLGKTPNAVRVAQFRALKRLNKYLQNARH